MNFGGAYSNLFAGVFSAGLAAALSTASSILDALHRLAALRGAPVCLLLVDLVRAARAVNPPARGKRTNALTQLGNDIIDAAARGSKSRFVVRIIATAYRGQPARGGCYSLCCTRETAGGAP